MAKAKYDISAAMKPKTSKNRQEESKNVTEKMTGKTDEIPSGKSSNTTDISKLNYKSVPFENIVPREINEFSMENISELANSIRIVGLLTPLIVVEDENSEKFTIVSGHRRYEAIKLLRKADKGNHAYDSIDCACFTVTTDPLSIALGIPYISPEQEEIIYRDSNLQSRQLSYTDVAKQIRYILNKFEDDDYYALIIKNAEDSGIVTYKNADKAKLIMNILSTQNYDGWAKETIRQFIKVKEAGREDLIDLIAEGNMAVKTAYKEVNKLNNKNRKRKTNKIVILKKSFKEFSEEAKNRKYNAKEISDLREIIDSLQTLIDNN